MVTLKTNGQTAPGGWKRQRDWSPNSFNSGSQDAQDEDLARAIAASLGKPSGLQLRHLQPSNYQSLRTPRGVNLRMMDTT